MKTRFSHAVVGALALAGLSFAGVAQAQAPAGGACAGLPDHAALKGALTEARKTDNGGFGLDMWGTIVNRDGVVCAVAFTGNDRGDQWPGSRVISAQKANTANAFSLPKLALSTANIYSAVQPGGSLYGLQHSNPVNADVAYKGPAKNYGMPKDPMVGERIGGVNIFGGGLALYNEKGALVGGLGVSGDSSCADHNIAWKTRRGLKLDKIPGGVVNNTDNAAYDIASDAAGRPASASGWGHPKCSPKAAEVTANLVR